MEPMKIEIFIEVANQIACIQAPDPYTNQNSPQIDKKSNSLIQLLKSDSRVTKTCAKDYCLLLDLFLYQRLPTVCNLKLDCKFFS